MGATQTELLEAAKKGAALDIKVSQVAQIVSFDAATRTATVKIMLNMVDADGNQIEYPPLVDCPCMYTRGGGFHISHPYAAGDDGIVLFSDRCFDGWFESGLAAEPMDYRIHSMSDAYFIGSIDSTVNTIPVANDSMFIGTTDSSAGIQISKDGIVTIKGNALIVEPPMQSNGISNTGSMSSGGDISTDGNITASGVPFIGHDHGGVERGGSRTDKL